MFKLELSYRDYVEILRGILFFTKDFYPSSCFSLLNCMVIVLSTGRQKLTELERGQIETKTNENVCRFYSAQSKIY